MSMDWTIREAASGWEELGRDRDDPQFLTFAEGFRQGLAAGKEQWVGRLAKDWPSGAEAARLELQAKFLRMGKRIEVTISDEPAELRAVGGGA